MTFQFSEQKLAGFGRKHLLNVIYQMVKQLKTEKPVGKPLAEQNKDRASEQVLQSALRVAKEKYGIEIKENLYDRDLFLLALERLLAVDIVDSEFLVSTADRKEALGESMPVKILLENIRSSFNVGSCLRSAESFFAEQVLFAGYTATPDNSKTARSSLGSENWIPWQHEENSKLLLQKNTGYKIYAIETSETATSLYDIKIQYPCVFLFGNERFGLAEESMNMADEVVFVPMFGRKNSLNVAVTAGIVLAEARKQWMSLK